VVVANAQGQGMGLLLRAVMMPGTCQMACFKRHKTACSNQHLLSLGAKHAQASVNGGRFVGCGSAGQNREGRCGCNVD
jgi:hypothetical protein